jgi:2-polyprenyl-6-methoxyphenol hydroxylase-like FAD-dependent oxidoreductase
VLRGRAADGQGDPRRALTTAAIIGAGLGGCALLAGMALTGHDMRLHDLDDARLTAILTPRDGRALEHLRLAGKRVEQIKTVFETGP